MLSADLAEAGGSVWVMSQGLGGAILFEGSTASAFRRIRLHAPGRSTGPLSGPMLSSIAALNASDIWVFGSFTRSDGSTAPLAERWNGRRWVPTTLS